MRLVHNTLLLVITTCLWLSFTNAACAEDFPKGTFTIKGPNEMVIAVTFDGKGKLSVTSGDEEMLKCDYKVTKDEIEFSNESGPKGNADAQPGTYKWKLAGKKLTFTKIKDDSEGRAQALTFGAWEKKG